MVELKIKPSDKAELQNLKNLKLISTEGRGGWCYMGFEKEIIKKNILIMSHYVQFHVPFIMQEIFKRISLYRKISSSLSSSKQYITKL